MNKLDQYLRISLYIGVTVNLIIALIYFLSKPLGSGDEVIFLQDLEFISTNGWMAAIEKGISIPYSFLVYPLFKIIGGGWVLRIVNLVLFGLLIIYFRNYRRIKPLTFYALLFFFFSSIGYFMVGTNDTLFIVAMTIFICETHFIISSPMGKVSGLWGTSLVIAFFTREMILLFLPLISCALLLVLIYRKFNIRNLIPASILAMLLLLVNYPSFEANNGISYDVKSAPKEFSVTWPQRQYLAQLEVNEGNLKNFNHPTWEATQRYLNDNGDDSLPKTVLDGMLHNPSLTIREFFKDGAYILGYSIRSVGLTIWIVLIGSLIALNKKKLPLRNSFILLSIITMIAVFSLVIISFVELRWLSSISLAAILYFQQLKTDGKISVLWYRLNYFSIVLLSIYGSYGLLIKLN